jgi:acyl-CoA thioester hydrolase
MRRIDDRAGDAAPGGAVHRFPVRIYFEDTDAAGIVYHANYLKFAERARTELMRSLGMDHTRLFAEAGVSLVVRHCAADFRLPARLDDLIVVKSRVTDIHGASIDAEQAVCKGDILLVLLKLRIACMSAAGRAIRLPPVLRAMLEDFSSGKVRIPEWTTP